MAPVPDRRRTRGPHPRDRECFAAEALPRLAEAADDLAWLLERGYPAKAGLALVGNRYALRQRQRKALQRVAAAPSDRVRRAQGRVDPGSVAGETVAIDGYNVLLTVEAALGGGLVLAGHDGTFRDLASLHGHFKRVDQTRPALRAIGGVLAELGAVGARWLLDQAISNSGRLRGSILEEAAENGWSWEVDLVPNPDPILAASAGIVATADSGILDAGPRWLDLARLVVERAVPDAWIVDLGEVSRTAGRPDPSDHPQPGAGGRRRRSG